MVVALGEGLFKASNHGVGAQELARGEQGAEEHHVVGLGVAELQGCFHGLYGDDGDVCARGGVVDAVGVVDEGASGLHLALKLVKALLVEYDGGVITVEDGARDGRV